MMGENSMKQESQHSFADHFYGLEEKYGKGNVSVAGQTFGGDFVVDTQDVDIGSVDILKKLNRAGYSVDFRRDRRFEGNRDPNRVVVEITDESTPLACDGQ